MTIWEHTTIAHFRKDETLPRQGLRHRSGDCGGLARLMAIGLKLTGCLQHGISDRANMRMNALEVTQHVEMQRGGFEALWPSLAQPLQVPLGRGELGVAQGGFLGEQPMRLARVSRHE